MLPFFQFYYLLTDVCCLLLAPLTNCASIKYAVKIIIKARSIRCIFFVYFFWYYWALNTRKNTWKIVTDRSAHFFHIFALYFKIHENFGVVYFLEVGSIPLSMDFMEGGIHSKKGNGLSIGNGKYIRHTLALVAWLM